jgi:hypothetical protein
MKLIIWMNMVHTKTKKKEKKKEVEKRKRFFSPKMACKEFSPQVLDSPYLFLHYCLYSS